MMDKIVAVGEIGKVLVVLKQSEYARAVAQQDARLLALIGESDRSTGDTMKAHEEHTATVDTVLTYLNEHKIHFETVSCINMPDRFDGYDYIITVGGDGTFLSAASRSLNTPMLGVRSTPSSVAHFSLADSKTFATIMDEILAGKRVPSALMRMSLNLQKVVVEDGVIRRVDSRLEVPVLNDVLVANNNAAAAAKYIIEIGDVKEKQDSSGLWIGPPSGSSAALRSAGGKLLGITDRTFEFVTREPSVRPDRPMYAHTRGLFGEHEEIAVVSRMPRGKLFVDGEHREIDFNTGDRAVFSRHEHDLLAFIDPEINRRYSYFFGIYEKW